MKALKLILAAATFASLSANACAFSEGKITGASKASLDQKIAMLTGSSKPALTPSKQPNGSPKSVR